jgi:UDP-N-acetylmuramoylalanine-D-glutamate ligase
LRYSNQNVAVLGAGLSGAAAALLLKSEGANVTVLDSADEKKLLRSTIDNLRAHGIRVICGAEADRDSTKYDFVVTSPGIDPGSALGRNFWSRKIDIIGRSPKSRAKKSNTTCSPSK